MTRWSKEQLAEHMIRFQDAPESMISPDKGKESRLQVKIEQYCREHGYPFFHDRSRGKNKAGWPDITLCMPDGVVLFIELKSAKGVLRSEQLHLKQQMVYLKQNYYVVRSFKAFLGIIHAA